MKKQDIAALIDGKIKGQGSAIDIGGALPVILGGLNDNSVSEDMDETEQMQMRKDLGLYYDLTKTEEKTAEYTDQEFVNYLAKISDDTPAKDELIGVENLAGELLPMTDFTVADMSPDATVGYSILTGGINTQFLVFFKESGGRTPGIYIGTTAATTYKGLKWQEVIPDKQGVPDEYIIPDKEEGIMQMRRKLGLYYEGEGAVKVLFDADGTFKRAQGEAPGSEVGMYLSSDATPAKSAIIDLMFPDGNVINVSDVLVVDGSGGYGLYYDEDAVSGGYAYAFVALEDNASFGGYSGLAKGIWLRNAGSGSKTEWLEYAGNVISKVPEKFLPEMGDEVEGNPTVPGGTSPTPLQNIKINDDYFSIPQGGGATPILATGLPDTSITTIAALDALGYTAAEIQAASRGLRNGVSIDYGSSGMYFVVITNVTYVSDEQYIFDLICGASYVIDVSVGSGSVIVTES